MLLLPIGTQRKGKSALSNVKSMLLWSHLNKVSLVLVKIKASIKPHYTHKNPVFPAFFRSFVTLLSAAKQKTENRKAR